jgi:hypothetical protein
MNGRHATPAELELYVVGALDAGGVGALEAHCTACEVCGAALAAEAALEMAFERVASRAPAEGTVGSFADGLRAAVSFRAAAYGAAGVVAMAAAVLLWFGRTPASAASAATEGSAAAMHHPMDDGAILDARNDALDGG